MDSYIREIGTEKIGSHRRNSYIKRQRITVNQIIGSRKEAITGSHIQETADKKTVYNEGHQSCTARLKPYFVCSIKFE